jgi:hypothetical protein
MDAVDVVVCTDPELSVMTSVARVVGGSSAGIGWVGVALWFAFALRFAGVTSVASPVPDAPPTWLNSGTYVAAPRSDCDGDICPGVGKGVSMVSNA